MKIRILLFFLPVLLMFSSCSGDFSEAEELTRRFSSVSSMDARVRITADFPSREAVYIIDYSYKKDGDDALTIRAPEDVAGVGAVISKGTARLTFDGAILETGKFSETEISPLSAVPTLISVWCGGNITEAECTKLSGKDTAFVITRISSDEGDTEYRTWFLRDNGAPLRSEIFLNGERIIQCEFERADLR